MRNLFGNTLSNGRKIFWSVLLSVCTLTAKAVEEPREVSLKGAALLSYPLNTPITNADPVFGTGGWSGQTAIGVQNIVQFEIDFNNTANKFFHNLTFTVTCTVDINCYGNNATPGTITQTFTNIPLQVNYNPAAGATYKGIADYKFNGAYRVDVLIKSITASGLSPLSSYPIFALTNKMIVNRQYNFNDVSTDVTKYTTDGNKLTVSWVPTNYPGAESFDLEWTYVDDVSAAGVLINQARTNGQTTINQTTLESYFRNNASRVNVPGYQYVFNLNYNKGFLLYRIRGVQFRNSDGLRLEGNWNYQADALAGSAYSFFDQGIVDVDWHEQGLNWQYNAVYAEDGKKKEVISYFDGALRSRQTVTINNEDNVSVVGEPVYDALGRPAMSILPAPVAVNKLQYFRSFNVNNSLKPVSYKDIPYANCGIIASPLSATSGVEQYYSQNNPFLTDASKPWNKAIPKSEGFPFSVTLYTPDNTGRVRAQGGVGPTFQLGTNRETKYYYGKPSQYELDRLFGSEAGDHTHYLKNMVVDANGQVSVSYQNSEGKTIASALAGIPPTNLEALSSSTAPTTTIKDIMITPSSFQVNMGRSSLEATNTFLVSSTGNYKFTYRFVPEKYNETYSGGTLCYTCSYDLLITLRDECGTEKHRIETKNITPFNTSCATPTELSNFFNVTLDKVGEYTAYFELVVNRETLDAYTEHYLQNNTDIKKLNYFLLEQLIEENLAECYNDCEACKALPSTAAEFVSQIQTYYTKEGLPFGAAETNYANQLYATISANCQAFGAQCVQSPCAEILDVIKSDVTPGGQYAEFDNEYNLIDPQINVLQYYTQVQYFDENGQPALVENEAGNMVPPSQLTLKEFIDNFEDSWATSLAPYHPEYCYYTWCTMNGPSQTFNQTLENMNDPTDAIAAGYFVRTNPLKLLQEDPFFKPGGYGYIYNYTGQMQADLNAYSLNVLKLTGQSVKNIMQSIDYLLYCGNQSPAILWDNCNKPITDPCRSDFKEWLLYKEWYMDLKLKYYTLAMKQQLPQCNNCFIPSSEGGDPGGWINCIAPPIADFSVAEVPNSTADGIKRIIIKYKDGNSAVNWPISVTVLMTGSGVPDLTQDIVFTPGFGSQEMMVQDIYTSFNITAVQCATLTGRTTTKKSIVNTPQAISRGKPAETNRVGGDPLWDCPDESAFSTSLVPAAQGQRLEICYYGSPIPVGTKIDVYATVYMDIGNTIATMNVQLEYCSNTSNCAVALPYVASGYTTSNIFVVYNSIVCSGADCGLNGPCLEPGIDFTINYITGEVCGPAGTSFNISMEAVTNCGMLTHAMSYTGPSCIVLPNWNSFCPPAAIANLSVTNCSGGGGGWQCPQAPDFSVTGVGTGMITACLNNSIIPAGRSVTLILQVAYTTSPTGFSTMKTVEIFFCPQKNQPNPYCIIEDIGVWRIDDITIIGVQCDTHQCGGGGWQCPVTDNNYSVQQGYNASTQTWDVTICYTGPAIPANTTVNLDVVLTNPNCAPYTVSYPIKFCTSQLCHTYKISAPVLCESLWGVNYRITCTEGTCGGACPEKKDFTAAVNGTGSCSPLLPGYQSSNIRVTHTGGPVNISLPAQRVKVKLEITTLNSSIGKTYVHTRYAWFVYGETYKDICFAYRSNQNITKIAVVSTECKGACPAGDCCNDPRYSLYEGKTRRFQDYIEPDFSVIQNNYYNNANNATVYPLATCKNECEMMADGWIEQLKNCTTDPVRLERVRRQLIDVCKQSCVAQQGSPVIYPYSDVNPSPSFESVIIAEFGSLTPDCAYDLISDPYPWGKKPAMEKTFATEAGEKICDRLQVLTTEAITKGYAGTVAGLHQYLKDYYSPYYDLEDDELQQLWDACHGCNGIMKLPVELPLFMNGAAKACLPCTVYEQMKAQFQAKYPAVTTAHPKYEILFSNYMNHQTGFSHAFANYYDFENKCTANANNFRTFGKICETPMQMEINVNTINECMDEKFYNALANATVIYNRYIEEVKRIYRNNYTSKCLSVKPSLESEAKLYEYHYTLYYYDQSDNLVKTVPPKGVAYLTEPQILSLWADRTQFIVPPHTLATTYQYNSFNQVVKQFSPDGGTSEYWYDRLGRLTISQNEEQKSPANGGASGRFSYTKYETVLGRITEVGEKTGASLITFDTRNNTLLQNWLASGTDAQITTTIYDKADPAQVINTAITNEQQFYTSRKRVVATIFRKIRYAGISQYDAATHYSYDVNGNAKTVWQELIRLKEADATTQGLKRMDYEYDLVAGKVNKVWYQKNKGDQFIYEYKYDAENRLIAARSSRDGLVWQNDGSYKYYLHGPLARTELGNLKVQGTDYAYTLQGWMRYINAPVLNEKVDIGRDGDPSLGGNVYAGVGRDALAYSINYFSGEYKPVSSSLQINWLTEIIPGTGGTGKNLYNGNIRATTLQIAQLGTPKTYSYSYDQLNRIVKMRKHETVYDEGGSTGDPYLSIGSPGTDYQENISYDPNGNIMSYLRNGTSAQPSMDNLTYNYIAGKNQLEYVQDGVAATNYTEDIDNQAAGNYSYDKIGNQIKDTKENITNIEWTVYGKISKITKNDANSTVIEYEYDAIGNRIYKKVTTGGSVGTVKYTWYVRDASGNTMALYTRTDNNPVLWAEQHLYGSSRLGMTNLNIPVPANSSVPATGASMADGFDFGKTVYELSNHLSNVLATISDKKTQVQNGNSGTVLYYTADVVTATDYYPFGMSMPGRKYEPATTYRFGFNGFEKENEVKSSGNHLNFNDYGLDPRLARRFGVDPIFDPSWSPYSVFNCNPIFHIDPDGKSPLSWLLKKAAKAGIKKAAKEFIEIQIKKRLSNYLKKGWGKQLLDDATDALDILDTPWWQQALELIPVAGDLISAGDLGVKGAKMWKKMQAIYDKMEKRLEVIAKFKEKMATVEDYIAGKVSNAMIWAKNKFERGHLFEAIAAKTKYKAEDGWKWFGDATDDIYDPNYKLVDFFNTKTGKMVSYKSLDAKEVLSGALKQNIDGLVKLQKGDGFMGFLAKGQDITISIAVKKGYSNDNIEKIRKYVADMNKANGTNIKIEFDVR